MAKLDLKLEDKVAVLSMDEDDNKLNLDMCNSFLAMLDKIEEQTDALTLVVRSGHEKIWSNGFDTDWVSERLQAGDREIVKKFLLKGIELRKRILTYPMITIAAINGHVFGGGAVLSCCFDFRFMRSDRGFFCIPAVDRGYPLVPGTAALLKKAMPTYLLEEVILTGKRYTGTECAGNHLVVATYPNGELMDKVMAFAKGLNKGRGVVGEMKRVLHANIIKLMEKDDLECIKQGNIAV